MAHSPHRTWKGCQLCKPHKNQRAGRAVREPYAVLKQLGQRRRISRNELPD